METTDLEAIGQQVKEHSDTVITQLQKQREEIASEMKRTSEATATELKSAEERLLASQAEQKGIVDELQAKHAEELAEMKAQLEPMAGIKETVEEWQKKSQRPGGTEWGGEEVKSPGASFVSSDQLQHANTVKKDSTDRHEMKSLFPGWVQQKADLLSTPPARLVMPQRIEMLAPVQRQLRMRDLIDVATTISNQIEYVRQVGFAVDGAPANTQTFGAAAARLEGAASTEAQMEFDLATEGIKILSHWLPASRELLRDAGQMQSFIDRQLIYGIAYKEDIDLLFGTGAAGQIQGIMTNGDIQTYTESTDGVIGDTRIDSIRKAMTLSHVSEYVPSGLVMNPTDWESIQLIKGTDGHYVWLSVSTGTGEQFFLIPVVVTNAMAAGTALVGSFSMGTTIFDREQASIRTAEQHEDFATRGMVAIIAEESLCLVNRRPDAFTAVVLDGAPPAPP